MTRIKSKISIVLCIIMVITSLPLITFADINESKSAKWYEGAKLVSSDDKYYTFDYSGFMQIWQYNTNGGEKYKGWTRESKDPRRVFYLKQGDDTERGYCIEHGIIAEEGILYTSEKADTNNVFSSLTKSQQKNIKLTALYGYSKGGSLKEMGFYGSSYAEKNHAYNWEDWYMATQILIWEIEQGFRKADLTRNDNITLCYGKGSSYTDVKEAGKVSQYHYYNVIRSTPAQDIYEWMLKSMKNHDNLPGEFTGDKTLTLKQQKDDKGNPTAVWKGYVSDSSAAIDKVNAKDKNVFISSGDGKSKLSIKYEKDSKRYLVTWKGKNIEDDPDSTVKYTIRKKIYERTEDGSIRNDFRIWVHKLSSSLHRQYIITGITDEFKGTLKVKGKNVTAKDDGPDEPSYFPEIVIPVSKDDSNPGWDGDINTPLGDAGLDAEYTLYDENGNIAGEITLDRNGNQETLSVIPFDEGSLIKEEKGEKNHSDNTHKCTVAPTKIEWKGEKTYTLVETPPKGRTISPDSGKRTVNISYRAYTDNSQECIYNNTSWSDISYEITVNGNKYEGKEEKIVLNSGDFTFNNDCVKGDLVINKNMESEDVTDDTLYPSKDSYWRISLINDNVDGKYLRYEKIRDGEYETVYDNSGKNCDNEPLKVSNDGKLYVKGLPYGRYLVEEVKADSDKFYLESFEVEICEDGKEYTYDITDRLLRSRVKLVKTDSETGNQVYLDGTKVRIKNKESGKYLINSITGDSSFSLDKNGTLLMPFELKAGTYLIEEYQLPYGYSLKDREKGYNVYEFTISGLCKHKEGEEYDVGIITVNMDNQRTLGKIEISKKGDDGLTLNGAVFGIYSSEDIYINDGSDGFIPYCKNGDELKLTSVLSSDADTFEYVCDDFSIRKITEKSVSHQNINMMNLIIRNDEKNMYLKGSYGEVLSFGYRDGRAVLNLVFDKDIVSVPEITMSKDKEGETDTKTYYASLIDSDEVVERFPECRVLKSVDDGRYIIEISTINTSDNPVVIKFADGYTLQFSKDDNRTVVNTYGLGRTLKVLKDSLIDIITTDENGKAEKKDLEAGKYYLKEFAAPIGYALSAVSFGVEVSYINQSSDMNSKIDIKNRKITTEIDIRKAFETGFSTNEYMTMAGAVFGIFKNDEMIEKASCDKDGRILLDTYLEPGDYTIKELEAPLGYIKDDRTFFFTVGDYVDDETTVFDGGYLYINGYDRVNVVVDNMEYEVIGEEKEIQIGDKTITVTPKGNSYSYVVGDQSGSYSSKAAVTGILCEYNGILNDGDKVSINGEEFTFETDKTIDMNSMRIITENNRMMIFKKENGLVGDVLLSVNGIDVTEDALISKCITCKRQSPYQERIMVKVNTDNKVSSEPVCNMRAPALLEIKKVDSETKESLKGAVFHISSKNGKYEYELTTDDDGLIELETAEGEYCITEIRSPKGYIINDKTQNITLAAGEKKTLTFENTIKDSKLTIKKKDSEDGSLLKGAEFGIYESNGDLPGKHIGDIKTDDKGEGFIELKAGIYYIKENKAPEGYVKKEKYYKVELTRGVNKTVIINNDRKKSLLIPETGIDIHRGEKLLILTLLLSSLSLAMIRRRMKNEEQDK